MMTSLLSHSFSKTEDGTLSERKYIFLVWAVINLIVHIEMLQICGGQIIMQRRLARYKKAFSLGGQNQTTVKNELGTGMTKMSPQSSYFY